MKKLKLAFLSMTQCDLINFFKVFINSKKMHICKINLYLVLTFTYNEINIKVSAAFNLFCEEKIFLDKIFFLLEEIHP